MTTTIQPDVVGRYRITERLCRKSESSIIRARNPENGAVLVKIINPDNTSLQRIRLQYEYQLLQSILLGGVARPLELIDEPGCLAMVLRDFPGESLDTILNRQRLGLSASLAIAGRLASTLDAMHAVHIVHKDISPSSILIASNHEICLMDFRLAARGTASTIDPLTFGGDLSYISPEQTGRMNRGVDYRTDLYSLGMTLYRMLSGQLPFQASDPLEWMHCHVARLPRPLHETAPELPRILSDIVMKLLQKMAEDRYQSARSLQYDLERCLEQWETNAYIEPFDLGTQGLSEQFQIPQRLYGRESEIAQLQAAFERMAGSSGQPELVWVAGDSGSGKSSLVRQWHKQVLRTQGLFIAGKAEQYKPHIPYAIVVDALRELVRQILAEPEDSIIKWKTQLQAALGTNGQLMVDMIPQLALIVGSQPDVPALPSLETKNRFRHVFGRLIRLFAIHAHPLVLFLDDLQWVDAASLDLIAHLLARTETCYLMLIASYRDNEVAAGHPLAVTKEAVNQVIAAREIHLGALPDGSLLQLLTDTLHCEQAKASPLAALIRHKTSGNPFFVNRFLNALHRDGLIVFDNQASSWDWDIRRIEAADVTDNVVELMARQISAMAADSQDVLRLAACLGYRFSLERVARLAGLMPSDLAGQIESAVQRGFLLVAQSPQPVVSADRQRSYRWAHDRILQAAYSLIADDQRAAIHAEIGRQLLAETPLSGLADELFDIVNHLNLGAAVIADHTERNKLAELNLM
ncbi:MAG TPA: AAA family ATPase, partial [Nitrosospira sp.]|nr:AAA family ATPase [Nitrosospira sp.]